MPLQGGGGGSSQGMFQDNGVLDPTLLQKGINVIKEQMKDVQKEALAIETEMERRFSDMINRNTQMRYLPKSLTDEIIEHKLKMNEGNLRKGIGEPFEAPASIGFAQIREAIMEKLGGEFDYVDFSENLKGITSCLDDIKREFKT